MEVLHSYMYQMKRHLRHFDPYHQFDLDLIFKVTGVNCNMSDSNLRHGTFAPQKIHRPPILYTVISIQSTPMGCYPDNYNLHQAHKSRRFVQWEMHLSEKYPLKAPRDNMGGHHISFMISKPCRKNPSV